MKCPCEKCPLQGCGVYHDYCQKYQLYAAKREAKRNARHKIVEFNAYREETVWRTIKRLGLK